jgi:hypothetical protein
VCCRRLGHGVTSFADRDNAASWAAAPGPRAGGSANRRPARQAPLGGPPGCVPARSLPLGWRPAAPCGSHVSRGCAGLRVSVAGSPLAATRRHRAGPGRAGPQHQGQGRWRGSWRPRSGQKAPGHGHGSAGLRPDLALPAHARQRHDHDQGDDDNQNDQEHASLLPATGANWPPSAADPPVPAFNLH